MVIGDKSRQSFRSISEIIERSNKLLSWIQSVGMFGFCDHAIHSRISAYSPKQTQNTFERRILHLSAGIYLASLCTFKKISTQCQ